MENVPSNSSRTIGQYVGSGYNGFCTITFHSTTAKYVPDAAIYSAMLEKIKHTYKNYTSECARDDLLYFIQATKSNNQITSTYTDNSESEYGIQRTVRVLWPCLGGMLEINIVSDNGFLGYTYFSSLSRCSELFYNTIKNFTDDLPCVQMDTAQGDVTQSSSRESNTIITADSAVDHAEESVTDIVRLRDICSTENEFNFDTIVNRWMALATIKVSTTNTFNQMLKVYNLPKFLYTETFAPNLMPFQNFLYGNYNIEFKFVVNANKFHVGKLVCAVKNDSYQVDSIRNDVVDMVTRPHVILDLSVNNEGVLSVPFKYHRTYVRNASASRSNWGTKDAQYATINVAVLSQLRAVAGAPTSVDIRPFYRIKEAAFTGMSFGVPVVQMESIAGALILERGLKYMGIIPNKDKPVDLERQAQYIPKPRLNFSTGKGASDVSPLKIDPRTMTTYLSDHIYPDDPTSVLDIARIWGFAGKIEWSQNQPEDTLLYSQPIDPTWRVAHPYARIPTPLEYVSSMYQFWSGPLELRLDFVSNAFHTGSIQISAEFGRNAKNLEEASSTYTKVFHLGEQKTVTFVIPYIFDTVWRRTQCVPFCPIQTGLPSGNYGYNAVLRTMSSMLTIRVVNALVPVTSVSPTIDILIYIRAGENFTLHSPIMANLISAEQSYELDNFPGTYPRTVPSSSLLQVVPNIIEGKTGREMRTYMSSYSSPEYRDNPQTKEDQAKVEEKEAEVIDVEERERKRAEEKATRVLANAPKSGFAKLLHFRNRWATFKSGYEYKNYVFIEFNNGNLVFTANGVRLTAELDSESIYDVKLHTWVPMKDFHKIQAKFHSSAFTNFILNLNINDIPVDAEIYVQMDRGDYSNTDPTHTFGQGGSRNMVQTVDSHVNIKDLLRRPVMMVYNVSVEAFAGNNYYYIPCMPPSHMMAVLPGNAGNRIYTPTLGRSYHVHLNDMFRFWRGSQRWTIVTRGATDTVYVSYLPHSGARLIGSVSYGNVVGGSAPICGVGLATEMIVPSINPTCALETPFDMESNWALMFDEQANRNFSWRDKGDTNCGHLVLWSTASFTYDLWWAAGDDFVTGNFIGVPPCNNGMNGYYLNDNAPSVQMERMLNIVTPMAPHVLTAAAIGGTSAYVVNKKLDVIDKGVNEVLSNITSVVNNIAAQFSWTTNVIQWLTESIYDLILVFVNWNVTTLAVTLLRLVSRMFSLSLGVVMKHTLALVNLFSDGVATQAAKPTELISGPFWNEGRIGKFLGLVTGLIGVGLGTKVGNPDSGFVQKIAAGFTDFRAVSYINGVMRFITTIIELIMAAAKWCCTSLNVEIDAFEHLSKREDYIGTFMRESQTLLDETNSRMFGNPAFKLRFFAHSLRARQLQREIAKLPTNQVSAILSKTCSEVIRKANEKMCDLRSAPVKYEPLVICISGPTNVGKSTLVRFLAPELLKAMGIEGYGADAIYTRMQATKFWNLYVDQPIVLIDEWLNIVEPSILASSINELYMLKSPATFIPEQAALEDKKARASPRIVIILANNAFPKTAINSIAPNVEAVLRRRDILIDVRRKPEYENTLLRDLKEDDSENCVHLVARFYKDSMNEDSLDEKSYDFSQMKEELVRRTKIYNDQENRRIALELKHLSQQCGVNFGSIGDDPYAILYNHQVTASLTTRENLLPSEQLIEYINLLSTRLNVDHLEGFFESVTCEMELQEPPKIQGSLEPFGRLASWISIITTRLRKGTERMSVCSLCSVVAEPVYVCAKDIMGGEFHVFCMTCVDVLQAKGQLKSCPCCNCDLVPILGAKKTTVLMILNKWKKPGFLAIFKYWLTNLTPWKELVIELISSTLTLLMTTGLLYAFWHGGKYVIKQVGIIGSQMAPVNLPSECLPEWIRLYIKCYTLMPKKEVTYDDKYPEINEVVKSGQKSMMELVEECDEQIANFEHAHTLNGLFMSLSKEDFENGNYKKSMLNEFAYPEIVAKFREGKITEYVSTLQDVKNIKDTKEYVSSLFEQKMAVTGVDPDFYRYSSEFGINLANNEPTFTQQALLLNSVGSRREDVPKFVLSFKSEVESFIGGSLDEYIAKQDMLSETAPFATKAKEENGDIVAKEDWERYFQQTVMTKPLSVSIQNDVIIPQEPKRNEVKYSFNIAGYEIVKDEIYDVKSKGNVLALANINCIHTDSFDNIDVVRYENGKFITIFNDEYADLPTKPCSDACPWGNPNYRLDFCKAYFGFNIVSVGEFLDTMASEEGGRRLMKSKYPPFMFPKWFGIDKYIKNSDKKWYDIFDVPEVVKTGLKIAGGLMAVFCVFKGMSWLWSGLFGPKDIEQMSQGMASGSENIRHFRKTIDTEVRRRVTVPDRDSKNVVQSMPMEDSITDKVVSNSISVYIYRDDHLVRTLIGVGVKQRIAIIPRHYYYCMREVSAKGYKMTIGRTINRTSQVEYTFDPSDFLVSATTDIALFFMPASTNMFKDITKYMHTDNDFKVGKRSSRGVFLKVPSRNSTIFSKLELDILGFRKEIWVKNDEFGPQEFQAMLEYNYSEEGACGSIVTVNNHQRPIMAMHVAGHGEGWDGVGYGVLLSQEMFEEFQDDRVTLQAQDIEEVSFLNPVEESKIFLPSDTSIEPIGSLPPDKTPFAPFKTKIEPSCISRILPWQSTRAPAILSKKDPRYKHDVSPLIAGCSKHGYLTKDFASSQLRIVAEVRSCKLAGLKPIIMEPERLTVEEAIKGVDHIEYYDTIRLDTSAGWPWCCSAATLKNRYCKVEKNPQGETENVELDDAIRKEVDRKEHLRRKGIVPFTLFVDTLKDEKKPMEKIEKFGATRVFCASPFDYTIAMRQNFLHFIAAYMNQRMRFDHAVGINVNGSEVTHMITKLLSVGNNIITIDYSNFGPGFNAGVAANVKKNMIQWVLDNIKDTDPTELACLFEEGINSIHAMSNFVYQQRGGSPSGSPITVIINSEVNIQYIYLAWLNLSKCTTDIWGEFERHVVLFVYGDDLIMSVSDKYIKVFNGVTIQNFFRNYDIVSTDASKQATVQPYETIYTASFLKKTFDHHPLHQGEWIAKTNWDSVLDCPHWIQEAISKKEATRINAEACLRESYGHGKEKFDSLRADINKALVKRKIQPILITWNDLDKEHYPQYY